MSLLNATTLLNPTYLANTALRLTYFRAPLFRTLLPTVALAYGIQTAVAIPSIVFQTERFYDLSGSVTYILCTTLSFFLPYLRARAMNKAAGIPWGFRMSDYWGATAPGQEGWWWRQGVLSACVLVWAGRLGTHLTTRPTASKGSNTYTRDPHFAPTRTTPPIFFSAFLSQATWVSICLLPVITLNALPRSAFATARLHHVYNKIPSPIKTAPYWTDILGLSLFLFGFLFESLADYQKSVWTKQKESKKHDQDFLCSGLWSLSRHPNYFGEIVLWTGISIFAAGVLSRRPALNGLGMAMGGCTYSLDVFDQGLGGWIVVGCLCAASPAFVAWLLVSVSGVNIVEEKYDGRFGERRDYREWKERTPVLVPRVPGLDWW